MLALPSDTWARIARSLRVLETFPRAGAQLAGAWAPVRFILGPWAWMVLLYDYDERADLVYLVAMHDARSATSATATHP